MPSSASRNRIRLEEISPDVISEALLPLVGPERQRRIDEVIEARLQGLTLLIENLHDPHNGAAVLRSAEAIGITAVHVIEAAEPFRFSAEVTQGCEKWLEVHRHPSVEAAYGALRAAGHVIYAAAPDAEARFDDLDFTRPAVIAIGNEHAGLTPDAQARADVRFSLPMAGMTRSFNLSVAAALALASAARSRRQFLGAPGDLPPDVRARLRARFLAASVRDPEAVVARRLGQTTP